MTKMSEEKNINSVLGAIESVPRNASGPVFSAPWEAEAFAMTLALYEKGVFTWPEWAKILSSEISRAQENGDPDLGDTYYHHWLAALERIVVERGITSDAQLGVLYDDWDTSALATPHGQPILLSETKG